MTGALDGIVVADFSRVLAGPYATMLLGDLGAGVIKVERAGVGDDTRGWGPPFDPTGMATYFGSINRNKSSLFLDLSSTDGLNEALALAQRADIMIENFKTGSFDRMGLGYEAISAVNPGVIYCSISGFGSGAGAELPGYDLLVQAMGGLMSVTGPAPGEPTKVGVALVDVITGLHAVYGILAALHHRSVTGMGQHIEVNLLSSLLSAMVNQSASQVAGGVTPGILGNDHPSITPYSVYSTGDRPLIIAVGNDQQFRSAATVLGIPEMADDERFATNTARVAHRDVVRTMMEERLVTEGADHWYAELTKVGVPCGPINDLATAFGLATELGLNPIVHVEGSPTPLVANPVHMSATPPSYRLAPPVMPTLSGSADG